MKKLFLLIGFAAGFVAGSKAGTGPYKQLESKVRSFARERDVNHSAANSHADSGMSQTGARSYPEVADPIGVITPTVAASKP
jgi:hypothetical protein